MSSNNSERHSSYSMAATERSAVMAATGTLTGLVYVTISWEGMQQEFESVS